MLRLIWAFIQSVVLWFWVNILFFEGELPLGTFYRWLGGGLLLIFVATLLLLWREGRSR